MNTFNAPTTQINAIDKMTTVKSNKTVDLEGYVIILVQTKDNKCKLYGKCNDGFKSIQRNAMFIITPV